MYHVAMQFRLRRRTKSAKREAGGQQGRRRRFAMADLTGDRERQIEALYIAICSGDTDEMEKILRSRGPVNFEGAADFVNCACSTGNAASVKLLLESGIQYRLVGGKGDAPLHTAIRRGSLEIVKLLLRHSADANVQTKFERRTPLHLAAASRKLDILKHLLDSGAEVNRVDIYGSAAIHLASEAGFSNGISTLLESSADPDIANKDGWTALHLAAANGHLSVVEQLVERHANVDCQNAFGRTPLHWACACGHVEIARVLLRHGASAEVKDRHGKTAFDHSRHKEIRRLLDAARSTDDLSLIPRITASLTYAVGDNDLRHMRVTAFTDALEKVRKSSCSYGGGGGGQGFGSNSSLYEDDDCVFNDSPRNSSDSESSASTESGLGRNARTRKVAIWDKPTIWPPTYDDDDDTPHHVTYSRVQQRQLTFDDQSLDSIVGRLWPADRRHAHSAHQDRSFSFAAVDADQRQRSFSEPRPSDGRQRRRRHGSCSLGPIAEDDGQSVETSLPVVDVFTKEGRMSTEREEEEMRNELEREFGESPTKIDAPLDDDVFEEKDEDRSNDERLLGDDEQSRDVRNDEDLVGDSQPDKPPVDESGFAGLARRIQHSSSTCMDALSSSFKQFLTRFEFSRD